MKNSLFDLKTIVTEYKSRIPKSNASKAELYKFASEQNLIKKDLAHEAPIKKKLKKVQEVIDDEPKLNKLMEEHEQEVEKEVKKVEKKVKKVQKEIVQHKEESPKKEKKKSALSSVQAIRKEKGISLKEAWEIYKQ
jgi:hypothetical protein